MTCFRRLSLDSLWIGGEGKKTQPHGDAIEVLKAKSYRLFYAVLWLCGLSICVFLYHAKVVD